MGTRQLRARIAEKFGAAKKKLFFHHQDATGALWLRTHGFRRTNLRNTGKIPVPDLHDSKKTETPVSLWLRKPLPSPNQWKIIDSQGNAFLFVTPDNKAFFLKLVGTRTNPSTSGYAGVDSVKNLVSLLKAGIKTESPIGLLLTAERNDYLISRLKPGYHLLGALLQADEEQRGKIAMSLARQLAKLHNNGFAHGHLHGRNIIVYSNMARIIDPTLVSTKKQNSAFEKIQERDVAQVSGYMAACSGELAKLFAKTYYQSRK